MEATHTVQYEGLKFEVIGDYKAPEEETGYKAVSHTLQPMMSFLDAKRSDNRENKRNSN
jgi:hypothetical protein